MAFLKLKTLSIATVGFFMMGLPAAQAQDTTPVPPQAQEQIQAAEITETQLNAYSESAVKVSTIHQEMAPKIQAAETEQQKKEIFSSMQEQMIDAVRGTDGITVTEYNLISQAARQDQNLAQKIKTKIRSMQN